MADPWVTSLLSAFAKDLVCGAVDEMRYPCCFNGFVDELEGVQEKLMVTRDSVNDRVEHSKKRAMKNGQVIHAWLEMEADPLRDNVDGLLKEARTNKTCCFGRFPHWIWRYRLAKKLAKKKVEAEKCIEAGREYIQVERVASFPSKEYVPLQNCLEFSSRQGAFQQLMEALKDEQVTMIGFYGMGGCGKTTMAEELMATAKADRLFDEVLFVPVSTKVQVRSIQDKIASGLQFQFPEDGERERARRLHQRLTLEDRRTLVILDDVWQFLDFAEIGIPFGDNLKNCKVMITTRLEAVCTLMDCQQMIRLSTLTDEEAWQLFQKQARISKDSPEALKGLGRLISNECEGLPVAIAALAGTLKGKHEADWKVALHRLRNSIPVNIEKGLQNPYKCLQVSYDNLDTKEAKSLLLLCSVFPEDHKIPVEDLTMYAIGLGLVGEVGSSSFESARNEVSAAKNKLISSSLLSSSVDYNEGESVKMHDLIRYVARWIASKENKAVNELGCSSIRYLFCKELPNELDCSFIEFLWLQTRFEVSDEIFKGMKRLRVLTLLNGRKETKSLSAMSFKSLTNIRSLSLYGWELGHISSIGDMKKLESLSLIRCSFFELSDIVITHLTNLRVLNVSQCGMKRNSFQVIGRHLLLEEFYYAEAGYSKRSKSYFEDEDHAKSFKMFSVPQPLRRYRIELGSIFHDYHPEILISYKTLALSCFDTSNAEVMELAKKAEVLLVANILGGAKNIIPDIFQIERGATNYGWIELWLCYSEEIECLVDTSNHSQGEGTFFFELRKLRIDHMKNLGALYRGLPPTGLFERLEHLSIRDSPVLTCLLTPAAARSLVQLQTLEIISCDGLKHILEDNDSEINRHDDKLVLSKLKSIRILNCLMLEYILPVTFAQELVQLKSLKIDCCDNLEYVFGQCTQRDQNQNELKIELPALEDLQHSLNNKLISIFPRYCSATCPSLQEFHLNICPEIDIMSVNTFKTSSWKDVRANENHFHTLETLSIDYNIKAESIFSLGGFELIGAKNFFIFQNLKTLKIQECQKLEVVFPASVLRCLPELKFLKIINCHKLKQIIEEDNAENKKSSNLVPPEPCFPKLASLVIKNCNKLKRLFCTFSSACNDLPNLEFCIIEGSSELEELIGCGQGLGDKVAKVQIELPKLKLVVLMNLPGLCQEIELPVLTLRFVHNSPKLNLTSSFAMLEEFEEKLSELEQDLYTHRLSPREVLLLLRRVGGVIKSDEVVNVIPEDTGVENPSEESTTNFPIGHEDERASTSEVHTTLSLPVMSIEATETATNGEVPASPTPILPTYVSELETPMHKTSSSSIEDKTKESVQEAHKEGSGSGVVVVTHTESVTWQSHKMQNVNDSIQEKTKLMDKEDEIGVPFKGSTMVLPEACTDTSSSHLSIVEELEASKHIVAMDDARVALLAEAIAVYPHLRKVLGKFSFRFQAWMLKTLADMLFFLRNESAASVTHQREKEFQELCDEAVQLGFDKPWVDEMRQRVMVRDIGMDHAETQLNELLKRHDQLTEELSKTKDEIDNLHNFVGSQKKCFDFL